MTDFDEKRKNNCTKLRILQVSTRLSFWRMKIMCAPIQLRARRGLLIQFYIENLAIISLFLLKIWLENVFYKRTKNRNETGSNLSLGIRLTVLSKSLGRKRCRDATPGRYPLPNPKEMKVSLSKVQTFEIILRNAVSKLRFPKLQSSNSIFWVQSLLLFYQLVQFQLFKNLLNKSKII